MGKSKRPIHYAVARGHKPGIYRNWDACKAQVDGFPNSRYKGFNTHQEAASFILQYGSAPPSTSKESHNNAVSLFTSPDTEELKLGPFTLSEYGQHVKSGASILHGTMPHTDTPSQLGMNKDRVNEVLEIWTDGSAHGNGTDSSVAGLGAYFGPKDIRNISERLPGSRQTNQRAELTAIIRALESVFYHQDVLIKTDSNYSIKCLTVWAKSWERNDWKNVQQQSVENKDLVRKCLQIIRHRTGKTHFEKVLAHSGIEGNEMADRLANEGALLPARFDVEPPFTA